MLTLTVIGTVVAVLVLGLLGYAAYLTDGYDD